MSERFEELRLCANDWKAETIALDIYRTWRDQWEKRQKKRKKPEKTTDDLVEDDKDGNNSDESDDDVSLKHGADRTAFEIARATKKRKSAPDAVAAANFIHTSAPGQTQQTLAAPVINMIPGALTHTGKEGILHGSLLQPMPSLQGSFNIINPLQSSHNAASIVSPFVGMPSGAQLPPQFASNVPALGAVNPIHNNVYPAQLPAAAANAKSRRMRPTKSITARNLCAIDWCKENKGTSDDFNKFWNGLPKEEKERYEALSKERSEQEKAST
ncbi:hypothetical protein HYPSUDRAFT_202839 [Hypholoma sublateritium FD-334 SS-4]|uniref:Uncharacterized protein n=1 Tax=Hypholoma sublateritium (strain FD-334 SS-4) TaxID=945553 RepID=A0A0D2PPC6_HYPSF|nr:hypothetical protein HYPSUDRAFT_202839 [Hypholoma sublateritium FD-334 SS-4]